MSWTRITPLGDQAALAYFDSETAALEFAEGIRLANVSWLFDVVQAYASVAVFFNPDRISFDEAASSLRAMEHTATAKPQVAGKLRVIPCCYEIGQDLPRVAEHRGIHVDDVVRLHAGMIYTIYAIGFCPGYPFLGYLPEPLCGVPRLQTPRLRVEEGSVGLTGRQTGIYTEPRPGGWNLVGRTPLKLVDVEDNYFPLRVGERIQFKPISAKRFAKLQGQRLEC
jgi:inhibitor of KinA